MSAAAGTLSRVLPWLAWIAAGALAAYFERSCARRGLLPPGFKRPVRRFLGFLLLSGLFWAAIFFPLSTLGAGPEIDLTHLSIPQLFFLQGLLAFTVVGWFLLGFAVRPGMSNGASRIENVRIPDSTFETPAEADPGPASDEARIEPFVIPDSTFDIQSPPPPRPSLRSLFAAHLGFRTPAPGREIAFGLGAGLAIWLVVLIVLLGIAGVMVALGGERFLPKQAPAVIPWIAGLPVGIRILLSLSAGVVEETFFRGLLQPRVGIALSTGCFVLAHASYGQPFMLVGVALLSLIYAFLVRSRQNLWPAIAAHALFDGVQLLVVIPAALRFVPS